MYWAELDWTSLGWTLVMYWAGLGHNGFQWVGYYNP